MEIALGRDLPFPRMRRYECPMAFDPCKHSMWNFQKDQINTI